MAQINVKERSSNDNGWIFDVEVIEGGSKTEHVVEVKKDDYERLTGGKIKPEDLVKRSFKFLLEREPKESILHEFNITKIGYYFPEWEEWVSKNI